MKTLVAFALALLGALPAAAQDEKLPMLEEWFSLPGGQPYLSYLPNFDIEGNGKNALGLKYNTSGTWYNRFPFDTANQFSWSGNGYFKIVQGDFNKDGMIDYMDSRGYVYRGLQNGSPPEVEPAVQAAIGLSSRNTYVSDFNNDGFDDVLTTTQAEPGAVSNFAVLVLGAADLTKMQAISLGKPIGKRDYLIGAYTTPGGKARVILYTDDFGVEAFNLVEFTVTSAGGTPDVSFTVLDKFRRDYAIGQTQPYFYPQGSLLYNSVKTGVKALIPYILYNQTSVYEIVADRFANKKQLPLIDEPYLINPSIDKDSIEDWAAGYSKDHIAIFSGNPSDTPKPRAVIPYLSCGGNRVIIGIGDVSGDGIGDLAFAARDGCFRIYKGLDWKVVGVNETGVPSDFRLHQNEPNPVGKDGRTVVPMTIAREGRYTLTLYDGEGKHIAELFGGALPAGEVRVPLDLAGLPIGSGFYTLRLSDGKATRERGILLTK